MNSTKARRNYFGTEIFVLKIFGVSVTGNESLPYKIYSFLILSTTIFTYTLLDFYEYFKHDASVIGDLIIYQMGTAVEFKAAYRTDITKLYVLTAFCDIAVVVRNRIKFGKLLAKLQREPFIPNLDRGGQVEEELVGKCVRITTSQTYFFSGFTFVTVFSATIYTAIRRIRSDDYHDWLMPFGPLTFLNVTHSPNYEISWLYQNISVLYLGSLCITSDMALVAVLAHIVYQFKILQNCLKRMVKNGHKNMVEVTNNGLQQISPNKSITANEIDGSNIPWEYLKKPILEAVRYHVAIIDVAKEIEEIFSDMLLFTFLGTLAMTCFSIYKSSLADNVQEAGQHLGEGLVITVRVALVCFWGEQVFQESQLVAEAVYDSNFTGTDLKFQKMLGFIIRRSQNPIKITAGMFTDVRLATLVWILRTSYSAFMVLRRNNV